MVVWLATLYQPLTEGGEGPVSLFYNVFLKLANLLIFRETVNTVLAREIFNRADIDGTKSLDKSEVRGMLKGLQIYVKNKEIDSFFEMYDIDKNKRIDIKEFEVFVTELLRKEELLPLFKKCCALHGERRRSEPSMTLLELLKFFQEEQTQSITLATLRKLNTNFEVIPATKPCISFDFFCTLIFSQRNTIFNPEHSYNYQVYSIS